MAPPPTTPAMAVRMSGTVRDFFKHATDNNKAVRIQILRRSDHPAPAHEHDGHRRAERLRQVQHHRRDPLGHGRERGEALTDVIFSGSTGRKPVGSAVVELIFDNSDGVVVGEYANFNEISVKRSASRDGQSQYYLNGARCR